MIESSTHYENPLLSETQSPPHYDALLVHGYWPSQKGEHTSMGLRTHFAARAAAIRWRQGDVGKIVVDLDRQWGPDYPALAEIMKDALVNKYHVPATAIIVGEGPFSTHGEVDKMIEIAKQQKNGWTNILDVSSRWHKFTVRKLYKGSNLKVQFESIQYVLRDEDERVKRKLSGLGRARPLYPAYEAAKLVLMSIPGLGLGSKSLENRRAKQHKPGRETKFFPLVDVYTLPKKTA
jgi:hypothetical protein